MPKISEHKEAALRRVIRDTIAIDPLISMNGLQRAIEAKTNRPIDEVYLKKLVKRVTGEMVVVADREKVEDRISQLRESNRIIRDELLRIAFPSKTELNPPGVTERRKALEAIARIENSQVKLEMDLGLFTRNLGTLNVDHRVRPLEPEARDAIKAAFIMWGVQSPVPRKIEAVRVEPAITKDLSHEQPKPQPAPNKPVPATIPTAGATGMAIS